MGDSFNDQRSPASLVDLITIPISISPMACGRSSNCGINAEDFYLTAITFAKTFENFHCSGLASAIWPEQQISPGSHIEIDASNGPVGSVTFLKATDVNHAAHMATMPHSGQKCEKMNS